MSGFNVLGFLAFLNGEVSIDDRWFGDAGPTVGGQKRPFWWRQHLPKVRAELYRRQDEIDRLRAALAEAQRDADVIREILDGPLMHDGINRSGGLSLEISMGAFDAGGKKVALSVERNLRAILSTREGRSNG